MNMNNDISIMPLPTLSHLNATGNSSRRKRNKIKNWKREALVFLAVIFVVSCNIYRNRTRFDSIIKTIHSSSDVTIGNVSTAGSIDIIISRTNFDFDVTGNSNDGVDKINDSNNDMTNTESNSNTSSASNHKLELEVELELQRLIQPGNHVNIPSAESRIGPNGEKGYVHNPKFLVENPPPFQLHLPDKSESKSKSEDDTEELTEWQKRQRKLCVPPGQGFESEESVPILQNIRRYIESQSESEVVSEGINANNDNNDNSPKLFCAIYTYSGHVEHTTAISETWGRRCDGMLFASDVSNATTGHMHLPSNSKRGFLYQSIFQRIRAMMVYLYDNFLMDYEFFHFCGDDTYVIVENMKEFLSSDRVREWDSDGDGDEERFMFAGFWTHWSNYFPEGEFYLSGGAGYTLSRKALKAYVEGPLQKCNVDVDASMEDIYFARCIREFLTSKFIDTRDEFGAHRYHSYNVWMHSSWPSEEIDFGPKMNRVVKQSLEHMDKEFGFPYVVKDKYVSNSSVTFHYHDPTTLRRMEMLLYRDIDADCGNKMES